MVTTCTPMNVPPVANVLLYHDVSPACSLALAGHQLRPPGARATHARSRCQPARRRPLSTTRISSFATTHWDRERKRRTHTHLALHPNPAPVQLDELSTECQPQPGALHLLVCSPHLAELLEHRLLILWSDADAGVADRDFHESILWHCADVDATTLRGKLDRIRQQVQHDLADLP